MKTEKYEITLIIDPYSLHIEKYLGRFTELAALAALAELIEAFQSLGLNMEKDKGRSLCYWVNSDTGDGVFYIKTEEAK